MYYKHGLDTTPYIATQPSSFDLKNILLEHYLNKTCTDLMRSEKATKAWNSIVFEPLRPILSSVCLGYG